MLNQTKFGKINIGYQIESIAFFLIEQWYFGRVVVPIIGISKVK